MILDARNNLPDCVSYHFLFRRYIPALRPHDLDPGHPQAVRRTRTALSAITAQARKSAKNIRAIIATTTTAARAMAVRDLIIF